MTRKQHNMRTIIADDISPPDDTQEKAPQPASILPAVANGKSGLQPTSARRRLPGIVAPAARNGAGAGRRRAG